MRKALAPLSFAVAVFAGWLMFGNDGAAPKHASPSSSVGSASTLDTSQHADKNLRLRMSARNAHVIAFDRITATDPETAQNLRTDLEFELYDQTQLSACDATAERETSCLFKLELEIAGLTTAIKSSSIIRCWHIDDRNNIHPRELREIPRTVDCFQSNLAKAPILGTPLSVIGSLPFYRGSFDMKLTALGTLHQP
jgi:hypothetical protein